MASTMDILTQKAKECIQKGNKTDKQIEIFYFSLQETGEHIYGVLDDFKLRVQKLLKQIPSIPNITQTNRKHYLEGESCYLFTRDQIEFCNLNDDSY